MVDYVSVTLRNRFTKITSLAGKLHRPIHLLIRTPSTREREGFMNLFLYVKKYKLVECTMRTFRRSLHDLRPRCPLQTSLSTLRVPDLQATPRCLALNLGQFREFQKEITPFLVQLQLLWGYYFSIVYANVLQDS